MSEAYALYNDQEFTYADYKEWELKPRERFELIYGVPYAMAAPNVSHQRILMRLSGEFYAFLKNKSCEAFASPFDVRLFYEEDESDDTVVQPDLVVVCDPKKLGEEGCRGAPDMVVEILSPSNTAIEMERKLNLYKEAQVREYWIVDPKNKHISIYSLVSAIKTADTSAIGDIETSPISKEDGVYVLRTCHVQDIARPGILPGLEITLSEVFAE